MVRISCFTNCQTTQDLDLRKIGNIKKNLKTSWNSNLVPSPPQKMKLFSIRAKKFWKIEIEPFPQCAIPSGAAERHTP